MAPRRSLRDPCTQSASPTSLGSACYTAGGAQHLRSRPYHRFFLQIESVRSFSINVHIKMCVQRIDKLVARLAFRQQSRSVAESLLSNEFAVWDRCHRM